MSTGGRFSAHRVVEGDKLVETLSVSHTGGDVTEERTRDDITRKHESGIVGVDVRSKRQRRRAAEGEALAVGVQSAVASPHTRGA